MIHGCCSLFGTFFTFASFILHLFIIIGQLSNRPFLNILSFANLVDKSTNQQYNLGLWNYCSAPANGAVQSCAQPVAAYNWYKTPGISTVVPNPPSMSSGLFLALFILLFVCLGLSFIVWLVSMPLTSVRHRAVGCSLSTLMIISFLADLAALILALYLVLSTIANVTGASSNWTGYASNSLWLTIGAVVALLFAFMSFGCSCAAIRKKQRKGKIDPNWKESGAAVGSEQSAHGAPSNYDMSQSGYALGSPQHQQQPSNYQTPIMSHGNVESGRTEVPNATA
ncbi:hypothetical protein BC940DRAFT_296511 [Gongronella butleri]|nr:hypothetical protein BC940DRAFT_296511 [Gongronella butleri]